MNNLNQSNKNMKILPHSFRLKTYSRLTLILGLGAKAQIFPFLSKFSAQMHKPKKMEELTCCATSLLSIGFPCKISHSSMQVSLQRSPHFFLSLTLGHTPTHTHKNLSNSLQITQELSFLSTQKSRVLGSIQEEISTNSSSKVRLCIDL